MKLEDSVMHVEDHADRTILSSLWNIIVYLVGLTEFF